MENAFNTVADRSLDYREQPAKTDSIYSKLSRDALLVENLGMGFVQAAKNSVKPDRIAETIGKVATSALFSIALNRYAATSGITGILSRSAIAGGGLSFISDVLINSSKLADSMKDSWRSSAHQDTNIKVARDILGQFAFDTTLMMATGLGISLRRAHAEALPQVHKYHELNVPGPDIPSLSSLHRRLIGHKSQNETLFFPIENPPKSFADMSDFYARGVRKVPTQTREYSVSGLSTKIVVPESYAQTLDEVRALRLTIEKPGILAYWRRKAAFQKLQQMDYRERALPEEFIPLIEHTPNRQHIKRLLVLDSDFAYGALYRTDTMQKTMKPCASAYSGGDIQYHKKFGLWSEEDMDTMNHEWTHLENSENHKAGKAFSAAVEIEGTDYNLTDYALQNIHENWAVHYGNGLLSFSRRNFHDVLEHAPIRSSVLARSLADILRTVPETERSPVHEHYVARVKYAQENTLPLAIEKLNEMTGSGDAKAPLAKTVLDYINGGTG